MNTLFSSLSRRSFSAAQKMKPFDNYRFIVTGCQGQLGVPLVRALCQEVGQDNVLATDMGEQLFDFDCKYETLDITDSDRYNKLVKDNKIDYIVHLAGILSALGERNPDLAIEVNAYGSINALKIAREHKAKVYIPSTIGVFGGDVFEKHPTPVDSILQPKTVYGCGKVFVELMGEYFAKKYDMDFRCLRYPGVISSAKYAFNGTTDYSTEIFFELLEKGHYNCPLKPCARMPMIYVDDTIEATIQYLKADPSVLKRNVYNLAGVNFNPQELVTAIDKLNLIPGSTVDYKPDYRQAIAESWPHSLDDRTSFEDWGWKYDVTIEDLAQKIFDGIEPEYKTAL